MLRLYQQMCTPTFWRSFLVVILVSWLPFLEAPGDAQLLSDPMFTHTFLEVILAAILVIWWSFLEALVDGPLISSDVHTHFLEVIFGGNFGHLVAIFGGTR